MVKDTSKSADSAEAPSDDKGERIAKVMARAGLCSRREAETWIAAGRVELNGRKLDTPAITVTSRDTVVVDGVALPLRERTRLWLFNKPKGIVTTNRDPEGRATVFDRVPKDLPRVMSVGRLDINTEGLLLLTNDGGLARVLELPATGWLRRYRVRAHGKVTQADLDALKNGIAIDGIFYGAIEAEVDREQGTNIWLTLALREGKNREVKRVLEHLGLSVNRLIRVSFGPFQLADLAEGSVREIRGRVLRDQLGDKLARESGADFDAPLTQRQPEEKKPAPSKKPARGRSKTQAAGWITAKQGEQAHEKALTKHKTGAKPKPGTGSRQGAGSAANSPARPASARPDSSRSASSRPGSSKSGSSRPGASRPASSRPASSRPGSSKSETYRPASSKPGAPKAATGKPGTPKAATGKPAARGRTGGTKLPANSRPGGTGGRGPRGRSPKS